MLYASFQLNLAAWIVSLGIIPLINRGVKKNGKNNNKPDPRADIKGIIPRLTIQAARFYVFI
jgi:hypothetical protein